MPEYYVTITARVTKKLRVTAETERHAQEEAHQQFDVGVCGDREHYSEDVEHVEEITDS